MTVLTKEIYEYSTISNKNSSGILRRNIRNNLKIHVEAWKASESQSERNGVGLSPLRLSPCLMSSNATEPRSEDMVLARNRHTVSRIERGPDMGHMTIST